MCMLVSVSISISVCMRPEKDWQAQIQQTNHSINVDQG